MIDCTPVTGQVHMQLQTEDVSIVAKAIEMLLEKRLPEGCFFMASFGRKFDGSYSFIADMGGPEAIVTTS